MKTIFVLTLLVLSSVIRAQFVEPKFGKVEMSDLAMTRYEKDTTAAALFLFDSGNSRFFLDADNSFKVLFDRHCQIKIFKSSAFDIADVKIRLYKGTTSSEKMSDIKVVTYNLAEGKIIKTKLENNKIYRTDGENYTQVSFAFPDVREGSVLELQYSITSDLIYNFRGWTFQSKYPERWSQYKFEIPEYYTYRRSTKGYLPFDLHKDETQGTTINVRVSGSFTSDDIARRNPSSLQGIKVNLNKGLLAVKDVPAFKSEPNIDCEDNYLQSIEFELSSVWFPNSVMKNYTATWESVNRQMIEDEDFGKTMDNQDFIKDTVTALCSGKVSALEKAAALYYNVQKQMKWDGTFNIWAMKGLKKPFNDRVGNSAEINLILTTMLKAAGLDAWPVIFSTRDNGLAISFSPTITKYNSVLTAVMIDGKTILLDPTDRNCPFGLLPPRDINDKGRIVNNSGGAWANLDPSAKYTSSNLYNLSIDDEGKFRGSVQSTYDGYAALKLRNAIKKEKNLDDFTKKIQENTDGLLITKYKVDNLDDISKSLRDSAGVELTEYSQVAGDKIIFSPFLYDALEKNIYSLEERKYPVNYNYPVSEKYAYNYQIPEGYTVESIPPSASVKMNDNSVNAAFAVQQTGRTINVQYIFKVNKIIFLPAEYSELKALYDQIVKIQTGQIILKKG